MYNLLRHKWYKRFIRILPAFTSQYLIVRNSENIVADRPDVTVIYNDKSIEAAIDAISGDWINNRTCNIHSMAQPEHIKSKIL